MAKDTHLVNIYLKIHNKQPLMMDDLRYLAKYAPECFEKTCKNVVYNAPETKPIMEPAAPEMQNEKQQPEPASRQNIEQILENIKRLEIDDLPVVNVDAEHVKNLLGNLYMEMLFPHSEKDKFMNLANDSNISLFDKKI